jgi:TPR repeat protein
VPGSFEHGTVVFKAGDYQKAFRLWKPLAEQGDAKAQFRLGGMYDEIGRVQVDKIQSKGKQNRRVSLAFA